MHEIGKTYFRDFSISTGGVDEKARTVDLSFSSEAPYLRGFGYEILSHESGAVDLSRLQSGAPLLENHDPARHVGTVVNAQIGADRKGRATVKFSRRADADDVLNDVKDGIKRSVSVGYQIDEMQEGEPIDGERSYIATRWTPVEISIVSIPADHTVGVGRSTTIIKSEESNNMNDISKEIPEIRAIAKKFKMDGAGERFIREGKSLEDFRSFVMESFGDPVPVDPKNGDIGMSDRERGRYSISRAIVGLTTGDWSAAGLEREASRAVAQKLGRDPRGVFLPDDIMRRDLTVGTPTAGGNIVATNLLSDQYVDYLRNRPLCVEAGATVLSGLVGNVAIPRQTASATAYWVTEGNAGSESQLAVDQISLSPSTVTAFTTYSRKLLIQSTPSVDALVQKDLMALINAEIDRAAINGNGSGAEPTGILNTSGIGNVGTSPSVISLSILADLFKAVSTENAATGRLAYMTNASVISSMMQKFGNATYGENPLITDFDVVRSMGRVSTGLPCFMSNNVPSALGSSTGATTGDMSLSAIVFGDWSSLVIGEWSGLDLIVDPYSESTKGNVTITIFKDVDIALRHAESFAAALEIDA